MKRKMHIGVAGEIIQDTMMKTMMMDQVLEELLEGLEELLEGLEEVGHAIVATAAQVIRRHQHLHSRVLAEPRCAAVCLSIIF